MATPDFRRTIGLFASGVAAIATELSGFVHATTANAVSSLSLSPALVLFCPAKKSKFAATLRQGANFSINFLRADEEALGTYFAGAWREPEPPPFRFVPAASAPRLERVPGVAGVRNARDRRGRGPLDRDR